MMVAKMTEETQLAQLGWPKRPNWGGPTGWRALPRWRNSKVSRLQASQCHTTHMIFLHFICIMCVLIPQKTSPHNLGDRSQARFLESHVVEPGTHQICFRSARTSYKAFDVPVLPFQTFRQGRLLLILISKWYFFFGTPCMCFCRHVREVNHSFGHCSNHPPLRNLGGFSTFLPHKNLVS